MILKHKFNCLDGDIDTKTLELHDIPSKERYADADIYMKVDNGFFGLMAIRLSNGNSGKRETFDAAKKFAKELCRRWNECETKL